MFDFLVRTALRGAYTALSVGTVRARSKKGQAGFTLIELLAVTSIIALISGLLLTSNSAFGGKVLLENLAYDIALSVRQSQVYGISVQRFSTNTYSAGYGVHFDTTSPYTYWTFADALTADGLYDCPTPGSAATCELVQTTSISRGYRITKICVPAENTAADCMDDGIDNMSPLDIVFKRPEPDACISAAGVAGVVTAGASTQCISAYESARIVLTSPRGDRTSVVIEKNGQISVGQN